MTTSIPPEAAGERLFAAPWEARAFALVHALHARGLFAWPEFQAALAAEIARGDATAEPTSGSAAVYYKQWFRAALGLLEARGLIDAAVLEARRDRLAHDLADDHDHG